MMEQLKKNKKVAKTNFTMQRNTLIKAIDGDEDPSLLEEVLNRFTNASDSFAKACDEVITSNEISGEEEATECTYKDDVIVKNDNAMMKFNNNQKQMAETNGRRKR